MFNIFHAQNQLLLILRMTKYALFLEANNITPTSYTRMKRLPNFKRAIANVQIPPINHIGSAIVSPYNMDSLPFQQAWSGGVRECLSFLSLDGDVAFGVGSHTKHAPTLD